MDEYRLPNGMEVVVQTTTEADFFYQDIFEDRVYLQHGIELPPEPCVFDVGANIGMFTLFVHYHGVRPEIHAFEPAPPLFELLSENVRRHGVDAHLYAEGLSDDVGEASLTFYPRSSGMSSFHGDVNEEKRVLRRLMENQDEEGMQGMDRVLAHSDDLLDHRFESRTYSCPLRPLSHVLRERSIDRIDLLKIDVQKAEHEVLRGIAERDWSKIQQVVLEVHDRNGRLQDLESTLTDRGFEVSTEQETLYEGTDIHNVYARRPDASTSDSSSRLRQRVQRRTSRRSRNDASTAD
jgi:FkbM family methyltransferase